MEGETYHELVAREELSQLDASGLKRSLRWIESRQGHRVMTEHGELVNFASNDYLGLSQHPQLIDQAVQAARDWGVGTGASRLVSGSLKLHRELEDLIADWKKTEAALTFTSGFTTSIAVLPSVMRKGDVLILDKLAHASLIDAARLCENQGSLLRVFPHNDLQKLERLLKWSRESEREGHQKRVLIVVESIYSMDGDAAPLTEIVALKEKYGALMLVDEAHAVGLLGEEGRGLAFSLGVSGEIEFQMGTFSKALGGTGGYVACSQVWKEVMIQRARSFIYTTAPSPMNVAVGLEAIRLIRSPEGEMLRARWQKNRQTWIQCTGLESLEQSHPSAIFPWMTCDENAALTLAGRLVEAGFWAPAIRYPTVPKNKARLRLTMTGLHEREDIQLLGTTLKTMNHRI